MELLHIGYFGDSACGKLLTDEIQEYGHQVSFISLERRPIEKFDLIITTENNAETIRRLQQQGKNLLTIVTNKKILATLILCKTKNTFLCTLAPPANRLSVRRAVRICQQAPNFPAAGKACRHCGRAFAWRLTARTRHSLPFGA